MKPVCDNNNTQSNQSLLKQFTYMHLKGLFFHFQKMVIIYYAMTTFFLEILGLEIKQFC